MTFQGFLFLAIGFTFPIATIFLGNQNLGNQNLE